MFTLPRVKVLLSLNLANVPKLDRTPGLGRREAATTLLIPGTLFAVWNGMRRKEAGEEEESEAAALISLDFSRSDSGEFYPIHLHPSVPYLYLLLSSRVRKVNAAAPQVKPCVMIFLSSRTLGIKRLREYAASLPHRLLLLPSLLRFSDKMDKATSSPKMQHNLPFIFLESRFIANESKRSRCCFRTKCRKPRASNCHVRIPKSFLPSAKP